MGICRFSCRGHEQFESFYIGHYYLNVQNLKLKLRLLKITYESNILKYKENFYFSCITY